MSTTSSNFNGFSDFHLHPPTKTMTNSLAISIVFTSLLAAQVWSPNPAQNHKEEVIIEQGHSDRNGRPITEVSLSPPPPPPPHDPISDVDAKFPSGMIDDAKDIIKKGVSSVFVDTPKFMAGGEGYSACELISDAIDKGHCKKTMSDAITKMEDAYEKTKQKASETAHGAKGVAENAYTEKASETAHGEKEVLQNVYEKASDTAHGAKEVLKNAYEKATDKSSETAHGAKEILENAYEKATDLKAKDTAHGAKEVVRDALGKTWRIASEKSQGARDAVNEATEAVEVAYERSKNLAEHKAHDVKGSALESVKQVKGTAKTTKDVGKTIGFDTARNVSQQIGNLKHFSGRVARSVLRGLNDGFRYLISGQWLDTLFGTINLLGLALAYGMGMWVTFISSHVLAGSLPRHQFGMVQSKIYAVYFRAMGLSIVMALLGHSKSLFSGKKAGWLQVYNLLGSLWMDLINAFYLEPLAAKVMSEKFRLEKEEGRGREMQGPERSREEVSGIVETAMAEAEQREIRERMRGMNERLKRLNSYSAFFNILTLMGLSWHVVHLGRGFHLAT